MEGSRIVALKPEEQVLLRAARLELGAQDSSKLEQLLTSGLEWNQLVDKAAWHETAALLLHQLEVSGQIELVPEPVRSRLTAIKLEQRVRFFFFLQPELLRVLEGMESAGVEAIPLKGAYLMNTVYPDVSLRPVGDLDLLAQEGDLPQAMRTLAELGYRSRSGSDRLPIRATADHHHCPRVLSPDGSVEVELHRHIVRRRTPLFFPVERFWERSSGSQLKGRPVRVLAPRDLVTHLCLAFFLDRRRRAAGYGAVRQLVDVSESIRHFELDIDWEGMLREYNGERLQGPLYVALRAARDLLETPVPVEILKSMRPVDFDDEAFSHFMRLKVLNDGYWFFHQLVDPQDNHWWNMSKAAIHRLIPSSSYLEDKYCQQSNPVGGNLRWRHFGDASGTALGACRRPRALVQELRADFWMNQIQL